ncbi:hypothetical protein SKAU_G00230710 [Synaphobranchus kaupii]|uniref:Uncharacterized protein n=1 Tax=Synaphobranchus kaupii TaxID=118154 RepID=A0A9Q1ISB9_SYNKA|nr:hypothetical protein SKAU_G00230710 [Synaphobranchus kaupii]
MQLHFGTWQGSNLDLSHDEPLLEGLDSKQWFCPPENDAAVERGAIWLQEAIKILSLGYQTLGMDRTSLTLNTHRWDLHTLAARATHTHTHTSAHTRVHEHTHTPKTSHSRGIVDTE